MKLKILRDGGGRWESKSGRERVLWEVQEIPGLIILCCSRHRCVGYQDGHFQSQGWMVLTRGNLAEGSLARQIKTELQDRVFPFRRDALQAVEWAWARLD